MNKVSKIDYALVIKEIAEELNRLDKLGQVANYIPELSRVDPNQFGVHLVTADEQNYCFGDSDVKFSIQSISKVFSLALALDVCGDNLWQRVGVEPSGSAFNSLAQLEHENGIPRNPFINAGALVVADILASSFVNPKKALLDFLRSLSGNSKLKINHKVLQSEMRTGYRNAALVNLMKSFGNIDNPVDEVLELYFHICSIEMTCQELAQASAFLASDGVNPLDGIRIVSSSRAKRINAIMQLCGFYDEAGEFSFKVGLPGKSGVGGGIVAVLPGHYSLAVWSPRLNDKGNSYLGMEMLERLTTKTELSVF